MTDELIEEELTMATRSESRKKTALIQVRVTPDEKVELKARAREFGSGMSVGKLCRSAIWGSLPKSRTDQMAIQELAAMRADLGRLGGLLKGWLAGSFEQRPPAIKTKDDVVRLLRQIDETQRGVIEAAQKVAKGK